MKRIAKVLVVSLIAVAGCGGDDGPGAPIDAPVAAIDVVPPPDTGGAGISAPDGEWTWIPFPGTRCMNGSETGLGVNLS